MIFCWKRGDLKLAVRYVNQVPSATVGMDDRLTVLSFAIFHDMRSARTTDAITIKYRAPLGIQYRAKIKSHKNLDLCLLKFIKESQTLKSSFSKIFVQNKNAELKWEGSTRYTYLVIHLPKKAHFII